MTSKSDILKSNMTLGASQVVQMGVTIIRSKIIAVFLGSTGMAVNAIFQSLLQMIYNIASCGLMQSGVRELSLASANEQKKGTILPQKFAIFKKLTFLAGCLGLAACVLFALPMSYASFGNAGYTTGFIVLGIGLYFYMMTHSEMTVLQGTRSLNRLAKSTIFGSLLSLAVCIPCYYYLKINGIVISIALGYLLFWLTYRYHRRKINIPLVRISIKKAFKEGKSIITLGIVLMIGTALVSIFTYLTNISIRAIGNLDDVGLFQGAASLVTQSIAVVFAVLASDFFPRLSAITEDLSEKNSLINRQLSIIIAIIPAIIIFIICCPKLLIRILLSPEFLVITPLLQYMAMSLIFRGIWITMSYIILAHGDRKRYLIFDAIIGNGLNYLINIIAYAIGGLQYLGISYLISSIFISVILFIVATKYYQYHIDRQTLQQFVFVILLLSLTYFATHLGTAPCLFCGGTTIAYCLYNLFSGNSIIKLKKGQIR